MNTENLTLDQLQSLYDGYSSAILYVKKQLEFIKDDGNLSKHIIKFNHLRLGHLEAELKDISQRMDELKNERLRFTWEYMLWNFGVFQKSVQIHFYNNSKAFERYGNYVTGTIILSEEDIEKLEYNMKQGFGGDGRIRFTEIVNQNLSEEVQLALNNDGFDASEIFEISFV